MNLSNKSLLDLQNERAGFVSQMRELVAAAEVEDRNLTSREKSKFDHLSAKIDLYDDEIRLQSTVVNPLPRQDVLGRSGAPVSEGEWRSKSGDLINVLTREQALVDVCKNDRNADDDGLSFGSYVRAMTLGPQNESERRALSEGTDSAGGYTVPTRLSAQLIDKLRAKSVVMRSGARTVVLDTDVTSMARLTGDPTASWRSENGSVGESDLTFDSVNFTARSLTCLVKASRELLEDSVNIHEALMNAFSQALALEVDRVALVGSGTAPEPRGIKYTPGIISRPSVSGTITHGQIMDGLADLAMSNANDPTALIMSPRTYFAISKLIDSAGNPTIMFPILQELPFLHTTQMPVDEGAGSDESTILMGDYSDLMIGVRSELRIDVLKERYADNYQYGFLAHLRADVQLARPSSFCEITGITAS